VSRNSDLDGWPDCLEEKSPDDLKSLRDSFEFKAKIYGGVVAKLCLKKARRVEREISRRKKADDE